MSADPPPNRNAARSDATRGALVGAARSLFTERGYADVGTAEVVRAAGVTRGALYHHFPDKRALFRAVVVAIEEELLGEVGERLGSTATPFDALERGMDVWLDACVRPDVQRIVLLDAPAVLGLDGWRELEEQYGLALIRAALTGAMDAGALAPAPVDVLARVLLGALGEAALLVARADDGAATRAQVGEVLARLLEGLRA